MPHEPAMKRKSDSSSPRPKRRPNAELRTREYVTEPEVERLLKAAKGNRWGARDAAMILIAYRHGLRRAKRPTPWQAGGRDFAG
jgi:type 1 fimbriae regulatory protein FimB/type 1 fimbriae regulatory protein FimE